VTNAQFWHLVVAVVMVLCLAAAWAVPQVSLAGHFAISAGVVLLGGVAALISQLG
jgi:hypothetical protein